jgi:protein phosphatase
MILEFASASKAGLVRQNNEDALAARVPDDAPTLAGKGALFVVADGVGGLSAGEVASRAAAEAFVAEYYSPRSPHQVEAALRQAAQAANLRVFNLAHGPNADWHGMQTTLTALALSGQNAYLTHVGDSRVYLLRDGGLTQLTSDHSEAAELLRLRLITPEQARDHPRRSVLTRTIGSHLLLRPDFSRSAVRAGDRFLLCTDGLWGEVTPDELREALHGPPERTCERLMDLAYDHGAGDNVSLHLVRVVHPGEAPPAPEPGRLARLFSAIRGG